MTNPLGISVVDSNDVEAPLAQARVTGESGPEISGTDDRNLAPGFYAELFLDVPTQLGDGVADTSRSLKPEVGEVAAHVGSVYAGGVGELLRAHSSLALPDVIEQTEISRQSRNGRSRQLGHAADDTGALRGFRSRGFTICA